MKPWSFIRDAEGYCEGSFSRNFQVPNTFIRFWLKTDYFSLVWHTVHTYGASENGHRKRIFWKVLSRVLSVECCGLMKTKDFENDDVTGSDTSKCACSHQVWYRLQSLLLFRVGGLKCNVWTPIFFEKGDKTDTCGRDLPICWRILRDKKWASYLLRCTWLPCVISIYNLTLRVKIFFLIHSPLNRP